MSRTSEGLEPWVYDPKIPNPDEPQAGNRITMTEQDYLESQVEYHIECQIKEQKLEDKLNELNNEIRLDKTPVTYPRGKDTIESKTRGVEDERTKPQHNEVEHSQ